MANALDGRDEGGRTIDTQLQIEALASLGLHAADLDLREVRPTNVRPAIGRPDFVCRRQRLHPVNGLVEVRAGPARGGGPGCRQLVHARFSAGPCVLAPSLSGLELCDPPAVCRATYGEVRYDGLGVLDRPVVPHLGSLEHPETALLSRIAARAEGEGQPCWG